MNREINLSRPNFNTTMTRSFDFALQCCGNDKDSGVIWSRYTIFVKTWEKNNADAFAAQRNALRKIYRNAVSIPLENLDQMWKDYTEFELLDKQEVNLTDFI